jgi:hypothetical protein
MSLKNFCMSRRPETERKNAKRDTQAAYTRTVLSVAATVFLAVAVPNAVSADVAGIAFTTEPQHIEPGTVSAQITVQTQDASGNSFKVPSTACLALSSSSATGEFSSSATSWNSVSVLTISKNSANRNFYYKNSVAGAYTLTARVVLRPDGAPACTGWPITEWPTGWSAIQTLTVGSGTSGTSGNQSAIVASTTAAVAPTSAGNGSVGGAFEQRIFVRANVSARMVAGADTAFDALALGLEKEPIPNARFLWSFGDGASAEGKKVYHAYHYPGNYVVLVEASSGEWSATDRKDISVSSPSLSLPHIEPGAAGYIEVANAGADDINLSRWFLSSASTFFSFPEGTIVRAKFSVRFPSAITGLVAGPDASLLYPNGTVAARYQLPVLPVPVTATMPLPAPPHTSVEDRLEATPKPVSVTPAKNPVAVTEPISAAHEADLGTFPAGEPLAAAGATKGNARWFLIAVALSITAAGGYLLVVRGSTKPGSHDRISAKDFEIIEDN